MPHYKSHRHVAAASCSPRVGRFAGRPIERVFVSFVIFVAKNLRVSVPPWYVGKCSHENH
jgi:hypothetical protein